MSKNTLKNTGKVALAVAITGVTGFGYSQFTQEASQVSQKTDPLSEILGANPAQNLTGDFTTDTDPVPYAGPISEALQECIDTPLEASENIDDVVYAPFNQAGDITQTREEILADIGPVLGHAVQNKEINWKWDPFAKTYKFKGNPEDAKLWYCYFKEDSLFFKEFLKTDEISVPFEDITTVAFKEKLPEITPDEEIAHTDEEKEKITSMFTGFDGIPDVTKLTELENQEAKLLDRIKIKMSKVEETFEKFEKLKGFNEDLISPKLADVDFWGDLEKQKSDVQKVIKFEKEISGDTVLTLTELEVDTTKEFSVENLEQELKDIVKVTKTIDADTQKELFTIELSQSASTGTDLAESGITSIKLKPVGDVLASIVDENTDESAVNTNALYELVIVLDDTIEAGTQYQAKIEGQILPEVLNEGGVAIENPITEAIFSQINEVEGANPVSCPTTESFICGVETLAEAVEADHTDVEPKTYTNKCEFKEAGAEFIHEGQCTVEDAEELAEELAELDAEIITQ